MRTSDHDLKKAGGEKYQGDSKKYGGRRKVMKKIMSKAVSIGLSVCLLLTAVPTEFVHGANETEGQENIILETLEDQQKEVPQGYRESGEERGKVTAETSVKGAGTSAATSGDCSGSKGKVTWKYSNGKLTITGTGKMKDMPSGAPWYGYCYEIEEVEVGEGVTNIGEAAFYDCYYLTKVTLPSTITSIGTGAFAGCYDLEELKLPGKITSIDAYAFQDCGLKELTLPASLKELSPLAFFRCGEMERVSIASSNTVYQARDGILFSKNGKKILYYPAAKSTGRYQVPSGVSEIGELAFAQAGLSEVVLPTSVKTIGSSAFQQSDITNLTIPSSVAKVGDFFCYECRELKNVTIKTGLKKLSYQAFWKCTSLESVNLGNVTDLDYLAFSYCSSLKEIRIPKGVTVIGNGSFGECSALKKAVLPSTVKEIAYQSFLNCSSLSEINFPKGLTHIYRYAFYGCKSLKSVTLPSTIVEIGENAFPSTTKLKNIPKTLTKQEDGSYAQLAQVKIKGKEIYAEAFQVLKKVNSERKKQGLGSLKMDKELLEAAMKRAAETGVYWGHTRPNGDDCFTASQKMMGENIAVGSSSAAGVMSLWMNSPGHKANILGQSWNSIGIGCVEIDGIRYWVQCFGTAKASEVKSSAYKNKNKTRTIHVKPEKEYYRPSINVTGSKVKAGETLKISATWYNGFTSIKIPASSLKYSSSDTSVCTVSKGTIKGIGNGTAKVKIWFPGYEKGAVTKKITVSGGKQKKTYTVKFNQNGGKKLSKKSKKVVHGAKIGTLPKVQRKGYAFKGWYTQKSKGKKITENTKIKKNQTFYAQWSKVKKPKKSEISSLRDISQNGKAGSLAVECKKIKGVKGYEISWSTSENFAKNTTSKQNVANGKKTLQNLTRGKTYYVRVRAYHVDSTKAKIYGPYSNVKKITIKN